jgi:hypothetical protein
MSDRKASMHRVVGEEPPQGGFPAYEAPTLTSLGSILQLTAAMKSGTATDPGDGFQPSRLT